MDGFRETGTLPSDAVAPVDGSYFVDGVAYGALQAAFDAARPGAVISARGTILHDPAVLRTPDVTLRGPALLEGLGGARALIVVQAPGFVLESIAASKLFTADGSGAFVLLEADGDMTLRHCRVSDAQRGLVARDGWPRARVILEDCVFEGVREIVDIGRVGELRVRAGRYGDAAAERCVRSRAARTYIEGAQIHEGAAAHAIELPDGGQVEIAACGIVRTRAAASSEVVSYGAAGRFWPDNALHFYASNTVTLADVPFGPAVGLRFEPDIQVVENATVLLAAGSPVTVTSGTGASEYLELADTPLDGPTWALSNKVLALKWANPGGDWRDADEQPQGNSPYATAPVSAPQSIAFDVTTLARYWLNTANTGLHLRRVSGPPLNIASRTHASEPGPTLRVETPGGNHDCPCLASIRIDPSAGNPLPGDILKPPTLMRFDLSRVKGPVTRATLTVRVVNIYTGRLPSILEVNRLDVPRLITDPARQIGGITDGIAAAVDRDSDLAKHSDILTYDDLVDESYIGSHFYVVAPTAVGGLRFERDAVHGYTRALCYGNETNQRAVAWHKWAQPLSALPQQLNNAAWRRPYRKGESLGYDEVYFRFLFAIGSDLRAAFNEDGMKLPGLAGTYSWSTTGAQTLPAPAGDGTWEARLWHSKGSDAHPHVYRGATYWYGADHPLSRHSGTGSTRYFNRVSFCFLADREYCVEQQVRLNTLRADGTPGHDGIYRVWVDGVLVHEQTDVHIRKYPEVQIQDLPFVNVYHGGMRMPKARYHVTLASFATATRYIGPPRGWTQGAPAKRPARRTRRKPA